MCRYRHLFILALGLLAFAISNIANAKVVGYRQHGPHVHGVAHLNIAQDGNNLVVEFLGPAINMVGFEHFPSTAKQRRAVAKTVMTLQTAQQLFDMSSSAQCQLRQADVDTPLIGKAHKFEHADFSAHYQYQCHSATALNSMNVNLFKKFPSIRTIDVQLLTDKGQSAARLTAQHAKIIF